MHIKKANYLLSLPDFESFDKEKLPQIAFIGRSNVGKSSFINYICNNNNLAKVSKSPGKTKYFNFFEIILSNLPPTQDNQSLKNLYFVDLPGYGYAKHSKNQRELWAEKMMHYFQNGESLKMVCLLVDGSIKIQQIDLETILFLHKIRRNFCLVITKIDKPKKAKKSLKKEYLEIFTKLESNSKIFEVSNLKKLGKEDFLKYLHEQI
jgi:GTP-binding protein